MDKANDIQINLRQIKMHELTEAMNRVGLPLVVLPLDESDRPVAMGPVCTIATQFFDALRIANSKSPCGVVRLVPVQVKDQ